MFFAFSKQTSPVFSNIFLGQNFSLSSLFFYSSCFFFHLYKLYLFFSNIFLAKNFFIFIFLFCFFFDLWKCYGSLIIKGQRGNHQASPGPGPSFGGRKRAAPSHRSPQFRLGPRARARHPPDTAEKQKVNIFDYLFIGSGCYVFILCGSRILSIRRPRLEHQNTCNTSSFLHIPYWVRWTFHCFGSGIYPVSFRSVKGSVPDPWHFVVGSGSGTMVKGKDDPTKKKKGNKDWCVL